MMEMNMKRWYKFVGDEGHKWGDPPWLYNIEQTPPKKD